MIVPQTGPRPVYKAPIRSAPVAGQPIVARPIPGRPVPGQPIFQRPRPGAQRRPAVDQLYVRENAGRCIPLGSRPRARAPLELALVRLLQAHLAPVHVLEGLPAVQGNVTFRAV